MEHTYIFQFFNNASVAAIFSVVGGLLFARYIYREQKRMDKIMSAEDELCKKIALLYEHCDFINLRINTIVHTWKNIVSKDTREKQIDFMKGSLKNELDAIAKVLMYQIPEDRSSIKITSELYFSDNDDVKSNIENILNNLKTWHDNIQKSELRLLLSKLMEEKSSFSVLFLFGV
jgi:hypothetical protein